MSTALSQTHSRRKNIDMLDKKEFTKRLAKKLQILRKQKRMSQEDLADRAGLYRTYIGHIENGRYSPSAHVLYKIIKALQADPRDFLSL